MLRMTSLIGKLLEEVNDAIDGDDTMQLLHILSLMCIKISSFEKAVISY